VSDRRSDFPEFVATRRVHLRRLAYVLCGDWHAADDIVQIALSKLYRAWPRVRRADAEDAYARQVVARTAIDESRRPWRRESPTEERVDIAARATLDLDAGVDIIRALATLAPRQRQVVVLRHWLDLSVEETAATLRISPGTVKSQSARGLAHLRRLLEESTSERTGG